MKKILKVRSTGMLLVMVFMFSLICIGISEKYSSASTEDTAWSFSAATDAINTSFITRREKSNSTKIYIYFTNTYSGTISSFKVCPYGSEGRTTTLISAGYARGNDTERWFTIPSTGKYSITNYVNERGYEYATLKFKKNIGYGTAKGVWSPDSTKNYTVLTSD